MPGGSHRMYENVIHCRNSLYRFWGLWSLWIKSSPHASRVAPMVLCDAAWSPAASGIDGVVHAIIRNHYGADCCLFTEAYGA